MLTPEQTHINNLRQQIKPETFSPPALSAKKIPEYFQVSGNFETMTVGSKFAPYVVANKPDYDCFVLAGIEDNELFSNLIMRNMNIPFGIAFDSNANKISQHFPEDIRIINKRVSFLNDEQHENLSEMGDKKDVFLKMNIFGNEYLWVLSLSKESLFRFKQMIIVFHDINNNPTQQRALNKIKCFQKLKKTHDVVNVTPVGNNLIVTYFRKARIQHDDEPVSKPVDDTQKEEPVNNTQIKDEPIQQSTLEISDLKSALLDKVDEIIKNAEQEIISTVTNNLKSAFDAEVEKILKRCDNFKQDKFKDDVEKVDFSQQIEQTQERVKQLVSDTSFVPSLLTKDSEKIEDGFKEDETIVTESLDTKSTLEEKDEIKEQTKATVTFSKPTFSPAPKPFSPETEKQKNKNAKKQPKKQLKKTVVLEDLKEDSAEDKSSSSSSPLLEKEAQQEFKEDETLEDVVDEDKQEESEDVALVVEED